MKCKRCGQEFTGHKRKYCSLRCRRAKVCKCGMLIHQTSEKCIQCYKVEESAKKEKNREKTCLICGKEFKQRSGKVGLCSIECRGEYLRQLWSVEESRKRKSALTLLESCCEICGRIAIRSSRCSTCLKRRGNARYAFQYLSPKVFTRCERCGKDYSRTVNNVRKDGKCQRCADIGYTRRMTDQERAIAFKVQYEPISRRKVFDADGWRCRQCGCKVRYSKRSIKTQATLDHIVPMSKGGSHTYANVQCLCRECNTNKATGNAARQLRFAEMVR